MSLVTSDKEKPIKGVIFGFDLDQTLIDSHGLKQSDLKDYETASKFIGARINKKILETVLNSAINYRRYGYIDAIFLLTNNSDRNYVAFVCRYISDILKGRGAFGQIRNKSYGNSQMPDFGDTIGYFFDYVMVRQHASRGGTEDPSKSLKDIKFMINALNESRFKNIKFTDDNDLASRTYFFDDRSQHRIRNELNDFGYPENYIQIKGPDYYPPPNNEINMGFIHDKEDMTDYIPIHDIFGRMYSSIKAKNNAERIKSIQKPTISATAAAAKSITENPVIPRGALNLLKTRVAQRQSPVLSPDPRLSLSTLPTHLRSYAASGNTPPKLSRTGQASLLTLPSSATRGSLGIGARANKPIGFVSSGFGGKRRKTNKKRKNRATRRKCRA
jgi:hypothetical protein